MSVTNLALVSADDVRAALPRVATLARRTPLLDAGRVNGRRLRLKCENMQPSGAFKLRGAANMLQQLTAAQRRAGVITYSSGKHGQAVAYAAQALDTSAVVVMSTARWRRISTGRRVGPVVTYDVAGFTARLRVRWNTSRQPVIDNTRRTVPDSRAIQR